VYAFVLIPTLFSAFTEMSMFDLNVPLQEDDWGEDGNQLLKESSQPYAIVPTELPTRDELNPVSVCSGNTGSTMQCTVATGQTLDSEESDGGDEVQSQSQDIIYSPSDPFTLSSMVYDTCKMQKALTTGMQRKSDSLSKLAVPRRIISKVIRTRLCLCATKTGQT
jgi:hypothetical protein